MTAPTKHALLGASSAHRWLTCPPSARLEEAQGGEDKGSTYAEEGSVAHEMAEIELSYRLGKINNRSRSNRMKKVKASEYYGSEMEEAVGDYANFIEEIVEGYRADGHDVYVDLEQRVEYDLYVPDGYGTADVIVIADNTLHVIDLKYGKGVPVSAKDNPQLSLYAVGAALKYVSLFDFDTVAMTIGQPRLESYSTHIVSLDDLRRWAKETVAPTAQLAYTGAGEFHPSESACRWCKAKAVCRARADEALATAVRDFAPDGSDADPAGFDAANPPTKEEFADNAAHPESLTIDEVANLLPILPRIEAWAKDIQDWALEQARDHDVHFPGYKLVEGRSVRKITDPQGAATVLCEVEGYTEDQIYKKPELRPIGELEKLVGKKNFSDILGAYVEKPAGKPTLVPEDDKRPAIGSTQSAIADFEEAA